MEDQGFLTELGRRLRAARLSSGLSVSALAETSGLSRRYVTDAEAGRANLSVIKLAALARTLGAPLRDLCDIALDARRGERIALVGLRGAGKSTIGRALALHREVPFVELDQRVEQIAGLRLAEIFNLHGEDHFHRLEGEALEEVLAEGDRVVIAAGGSIVSSTANFARLRAACRTVWLRAHARDHYQRVLAQGDRRPMADHPRAMDQLEQLLEKREPAYAQCEIVIETSGKDVGEITREIAEQIQVS